MKTTHKLGIYLDHASATLIEFSITSRQVNSIESEFTFQDKMEGLVKSEKHMHIKEQHLQTSFYLKIAEIIKQYNEVLIFGPTNAKVELYNLIKNDHLFSKIKIVLQHTDQLTDT